MENGRMKIMIAYDGSTFADAAIDDLARAGFPRQSEVLVASVADFSSMRPLVPEFDLISAASRRIDAVLVRGKRHRERVLHATEDLAVDAASRIKDRFPEWKVSSEVLEGDPADALLRAAADWDADLIVGGSQGRSAIGRFFLGSVSRSAAERADRSVRIVRANEPGEDATILLGVKSPKDAEYLVEYLLRRSWAKGTLLHIIGIDDGIAVDRISAFYPDGDSVYRGIAEPVVEAGLDVSVRVENGDPKSVLLGAASKIVPDAIFISAGSGEAGSGADETALGLVTGAKCTVEIVR